MSPGEVQILLALPRGGADQWGPKLMVPKKVSKRAREGVREVGARPSSLARGRATSIFEVDRFQGGEGSVAVCFRVRSRPRGRKNKIYQIQHLVIGPMLEGKRNCRETEPVGHSFSSFSYHSAARRAQEPLHDRGGALLNNFHPEFPLLLPVSVTHSHSQCRAWTRLHRP